MAVSLVITNGTVVTSMGAVKTDVAIQGDKILGIGDKSVFPKAEKVYDAKGKIVIPGGIDPHTHFEQIYMGTIVPTIVKEKWDTASIASAIGGTTTVIDFAQQEKGKTLMDVVKAQFVRAAELSAIDYSTSPIITDLSDMDKLLGSFKEVIDYGLPTFKGATIYTSTGWYEDDWQLFRVMRKIQELDGMMSIHAENCLIGEGWQAELVSQGKTDPVYHGVAKPNFEEDMDIIKCMMLAEALGTRTYIVHVSTEKGPGIIDSYRKKGLPVYCETCTHYLWLTEDTFAPKFPTGIMYMCSPPLRKQADIEALWNGIKSGIVQTVGSDHVCFTKQQKEEGSGSFIDIPNGFPGVEARVPVVFQEGVLKRNVSLEKFAEVVATNPAKLFGMYPKKGVIAPGSDADIVVIDPEKKHSLNAADLHMGTDLSVFEGMQVTGWPVLTVLRGQIIVENERFVGKKGEGQFVKGKLDEKIMATV